MTSAFCGMIPAARSMKPEACGMNHEALHMNRVS